MNSRLLPLCILLAVVLSAATCSESEKTAPQYESAEELRAAVEKMLPERHLRENERRSRARTLLEQMREGEKIRGQLEIAISDENGEPLRAVVELADSLDRDRKDVHPGTAKIIDGHGQIDCIAGNVTVFVSAGPRRTIHRSFTTVAPGEVLELNVTLFPLKSVEALAQEWTVVDFSPQSADFPAVGFDPVAVEDRAVCTAGWPGWGELVIWNCTAENERLLRILSDTPEIPLARTAASAGGGTIVASRLLTDALLLDPEREAVAARPELSAYYKGYDTALKEFSAELPFDVICTDVFDAIGSDLSAEGREVLRSIYSLGYRYPAVYSAEPTSVVDVGRTWVKAGATPAEIVEAVRSGMTVYGRGAFISLDIGGYGPGQVARPSPQPFELNLRAVATSDAAHLQSIELFVNGERLFKEDITGERSVVAIRRNIDIASNAWIAARCVCAPLPYRKTTGQLVTWTSPVFFATPATNIPPAPVCHIEGRVLRAGDKQPLAGATVAVEGKDISVTTGEDGEYDIECAPTDILSFNAPEHSTRKMTLFRLSGCSDYLWGLHTNRDGTRWRPLARTSTYMRVRELLAHTRVDIVLEEIRDE